MTERLATLQDQYKENPSETLREEIKRELLQNTDGIFDIDNLTPVVHNWIDRGLVMSCENAGHPNHRHFKRKK